MPELEISYDPSDEQERILTASRDNVECGVLNFGPKEDDPNTFRINWLKSNMERQGIATQLIRKMVDILGPGVKISSVVTHDETERVIRDLGYYDQAKMHGGVEIVKREIIDSLPIVKVRTAGGIFTDKIEVGFDPGETENPFHIQAEGITDPRGAYRAAALNKTNS